MMRKAFIFTLILALALPASLIGSGFILKDSTAFAEVTSAEERAQLEAELRALEQEIKEKEAILKGQQQKTGTLKKDVALLTSQIETAKLKIRAKTIAINKLGQEIIQKSEAINDLESEINRERNSIAQLIKYTNELDQKGVAYVLLSADSVSDFYQDLDDFTSVKRSLYASVNKIKQVKSLTEDQKEQLESKKEDELDARSSIDYQKKVVEQSEREKKTLLQISQSKEKEYQAVLAERQKRVTEIRNKLFSFAGGSTKAIPFANALQYAEAASTETGVSPAFLLAILTQESNLGKNVGQCYLTNPETGAGVNKNSGKVYPNVMKPSRDVGPFLEVTKTLGIDPYKAIVSCPIQSSTYWNSGSFGPSQFLPSTWNLFISKLQTALGRYPNPWAPSDAIMASALYLAQLGGTGDSVTAQSKAACRYNGGGTGCGYGKSVMAIARRIQSDIDYLKQYGVSRR
ncbi:MAG: hypothetical protein AAB681_03385 [Patescibacteria group bacterium]